MQLTTTEIMGGLGNQLFQIFNLLAYTLRHRIPFYFSQEPIQHGQRKQTYWHTQLLKALKPFVKSPPNNNPIVLHEREFHYQPISFYEQDHMKLFGYYQSYKYFEEQQANIYKLIKLHETKTTIKEKTNYTDYDRTVAVHFRVGDYVQLPNHHPLMSINYYTKALEQFLNDQSQAAQAQTKETTSEPWHILYFCEENDQTYVETQLIQPLQAHPTFNGKFTFQCIDHHLADWEQLIVMSLCQNHIIANSTFSWWGAYLANNHTTNQNGGNLTNSAEGVGDRPHVYYPTTWFGPAIGYKNMADLFPPHWNKILI
jgi:pterin-4a-carbinolamine dehydratase